MVLALIQMRMSFSLSTSSTLVVNVFSLSEPTIVRTLPLMSKTKQSRMEIVFFPLMMRPAACKREESSELDTTNFINY